MRSLSFLDQTISQTQQILETLFGEKKASRENPAATIKETLHRDEEKKEAARLMRINHVGEVCAQALYQGQALVAKNKSTQVKLEIAAQEEVDHLVWCKERIEELGGRTSWLNPLWYVGSLAMGMAAGLMGDKTSLGFLAETEHQVENHLTNHLQKLPANDKRSRKILLTMREDEIKHAKTAEDEGADPLPEMVKLCMRCAAKVMTTTTYWI